ncbi:hypothetical protein TRV_05491, partial [Trichophyton verrucosum HKI 0517]
HPLPNDLVKCSTASKKQRELSSSKQKDPAGPVCPSAGRLQTQRGTSAAAVIWPAAEVSRRRSTSEQQPTSRLVTTTTPPAKPQDEDANGRRAAGRETAVEGDEAPRRRRPPRALSSSPSPLLPPSASDPPSALPPVTARRCPLPASQSVESPAAGLPSPSTVESRLSGGYPTPEGPREEKRPLRPTANASSRLGRPSRHRSRNAAAKRATANSHLGIALLHILAQGQTRDGLLPSFLRSLLPQQKERKGKG